MTLTVIQTACSTCNLRELCMPLGLSEAELNRLDDLVLLPLQHISVLGRRLHGADVEARQHFDFGAIDWSEFWQVVGGDGPCNRERLSDRVKAWEDGAWVREAALAHAAKQEGQRAVA